MSRGALFDATRCIGCRACQVACKRSNRLAAELDAGFYLAGRGYQNRRRPSAESLTLVTFNEPEAGERRWVFGRRQCLHCLDPACVSACLVEALRRSDDGAVVYDASRCIGCRYCLLACPFSAPGFEWRQAISYVRKCGFCHERWAGGSAPRSLDGAPLPEPVARRYRQQARRPACVATCPTGALEFGERERLLDEARRRLRRRPEQYHQHVYGEHEAGGTAWLLLSPVDFAALGLPARLTPHPYPALARAAREAVPIEVLGVSAVVAGFYWFTRRKRLVAEQQRAREQAHEPDHDRD